jgi:hypothetical protein
MKKSVSLFLLITAFAQPALAMDPQMEQALKLIDPDKHFDEVRKYLGQQEWSKKYVTGDEATYDQSLCDKAGKNCQLLNQVTKCVGKVTKDSYELSSLTVAPGNQPNFNIAEMSYQYAFAAYDGYVDVLAYIFYLMSLSPRDFLIHDVRQGKFIIRALGEEVETREIRVGAQATSFDDMPIISVSNNPNLPGIAQKVKDYFKGQDGVFKTELIYAARGADGNKCKEWK